MLGKAYLSCVLAVALSAAGVSAEAQEKIRIAFDDPLSGGNGNVGEQALKAMNFYADRINKSGALNGAEYEIVPFDNKSDPQEALVQAQKAIDQGIRIIAQGISASSVGAALTDFIAKHNERNPGEEVLYLNIAANDGSLTNDKCEYWHFRFSSHNDMKTTAMAAYIASQPEIKKIYMINPDYTAGRAVAEVLIDELSEKRPDIEIVGNDLFPVFKVTDFSPYVGKITASGADTIVTSAFAQDMALLMKAAADAQVKERIFTFYANNPGGPTAMKQAGMDHQVFNLVDTFANNPPAMELQKEFRAEHGFSLMVPGVMLSLNHLTEAINKTGSTDPVELAAALEGMKLDSFNGDVGFLRPDDHQYFQDQYITTLGPVTEAAPLDEEGTGWGWLPVDTVAASEAMLPTTCEMERP